MEKKKHDQSVENLSKVYSQIDRNYLYVKRVGKLDILWSVNKLARSITKWIKACDKRPSLLIFFYIHHKKKTKNIAMWKTLLNKVDQDCFKTPILKEILRI